MEAATATPTPSASATPASAPAPSAGTSTPSVSTPTPDQRPTMAQAFANDVAPPTPESPAHTDTPTTQAAEITDPASVHPSTKEQGPIPFAVHKKTLDNAYAERDTAKAQLQTMTPVVERWGPIARQMEKDPAGFIRSYIAEVAARDPNVAQQMRSEAARILGARAPQAEPMPSADIEILDAHGQVTGRTYSDAQLQKRDAWNERRILASLQKEIAPFKQERDQRQAETKAAEQTKAAHVRADKTLSTLDRILDGAYSQKDAEVLTAVNQAMEAHPDWDASDAALHVKETLLKGRGERKAQTQVLDDLKTKAAASTVNPSSAVVAATKRPASFHDKSLTW